MAVYSRKLADTGWSGTDYLNAAYMIDGDQAPQVQSAVYHIQVKFSPARLAAGTPYRVEIREYWDTPNAAAYARVLGAADLVANAIGNGTDTGRLRVEVPVHKAGTTVTVLGTGQIEAGIVEARFIA